LRRGSARASRSLAVGWELNAIAAVVVGGTLLTGGQGGVGSTLVGLLLLGLIFNIFNLEGWISARGGNSSYAA
jgi:ribose/xylose/arabinose/galactoside ABC-type transport system permease subunit